MYTSPARLAMLTRCCTAHLPSPEQSLNCTDKTPELQSLQSGTFLKLLVSSPASAEVALGQPALIQCMLLSEIFICCDFLVVCRLFFPFFFFFFFFFYFYYFCNLTTSTWSVVGFYGFYARSYLPYRTPWTRITGQVYLVKTSTNQISSAFESGYRRLFIQK